MKTRLPTRLVIFDMDGTLLQKITILHIGEKLGITKELSDIMNTPLQSMQRNKRIAMMLKGCSKQQLLTWFHEIELHDNVEMVISELKKRSILTALATNTYLFFAKEIQKRLAIDFVFANNLIINEGIVTGEFEPVHPLLEKRFAGCKLHPICKYSIVDELCTHLSISADQVIAVGDGSIDICMLKKAGVGVAFQATPEVCKHADVCISDMSEILAYIS